MTRNTKIFKEIDSSLKIARISANIFCREISKVLEIMNM